MAVDNDHARLGHPRQGSTPASHMWARQLPVNFQANRKEEEKGQLAGHAAWSFCSRKTRPEHGGTRPGTGPPSARPCRSCRDLNHGRPHTFESPDLLERPAHAASCRRRVASQAPPPRRAAMSRRRGGGQRARVEVHAALRGSVGRHPTAGTPPRRSSRESRPALRKTPLRQPVIQRPRRACGTGILRGRARGNRRRGREQRGRIFSRRFTKFPSAGTRRLRPWYILEKGR
jgi:hypothetical protein